MVIDKMWCINDIWQTIEQKFRNDAPWLSDIGIGLAWSKAWKSNYSKKFKNIRKHQECTVLGLEVWYYPIESSSIFFSWLEDYVSDRNSIVVGHKSQMPIFPEAGYSPNSKYKGQKVYFTGFYSKDRKTIEDIIVPQTGIIDEKNFKKSTDYLIMGPNRGPAKIEKAKKDGIPCISVEIFIEEVIKME